ncbi:type ISP restriction/modification enzyme [Streptomyces sp. NPDC058297]|uniref:type ISP restriction/modification enzyme n=1 Tax=Streptomyces sp. NPDC058297 TaxID=3346433 RepID=UPI0036F02488
MPGVTPDSLESLVDAPLLADLMPWSVAPLRLGRAWPLAPDPASLKARWAVFVKAAQAERETLLEPSRARTLRTAVAQLPGRRTATDDLTHAEGPCPEPVRVLHAPFDEQWLIPDHRLIDAARPELWRVADEDQLFVVEQGFVPGAGGPAVLACAILPEGRSPAGRPGRIRPLYRRPGGLEPNVTPGLLTELSGRFGHEVGARDLLAWTLAAARPSPQGPRVPLPDDAGLWASGTALGERILWLLRRGADGDRPKLPGGRRPYVRAPLPDHPQVLNSVRAGETPFAELLYDREEQALLIGDGRISPVPAEAWDFRVSGVRVIEQWFARRTTAAEPGTLAGIRPRSWPQPWTSELLEIVTVLALLAELRTQQEELTAEPTAFITATVLREARILPPAPATRRPASVFDHHEEGPGGQFALL